MKLIDTKGRTKVHTSSQLRAALEMTDDQWTRATVHGLIPAADRPAGTYSGWHVDDLVQRRAEILAAIPDDLTRDQLQKALGLDYGQWRRARAAALIPGPDRAGYWTRATVADLLADPERLRAAIPPQPLRARRIAKYLAEATGLQVEPADVEQLARAGLTRVADVYDDVDLYDMTMIQQVVERDEGRAALGAIVAERQAWIAASLDARAAAARLGWSVQEFAAVATERGLEPGCAARYPAAAIEQLAGDEDLADRVRRARLLGPDQAVEYLELPRRTEFDYLVAAGLIGPTGPPVDVRVGKNKYVPVDLYRIADLEDLREIAWIDWEQLRCLRPGEPSPLREYARLPTARAVEIRAFCQQLSEQFQIAVWPRWISRADRWEVDWEQHGDGTPTRAQVEAALHRHAGAAKHAAQIRLSTAVGDQIRWARAMLRPGAAAVLHLAVAERAASEIVLLDASDARVLLHTAIFPDTPSDASPAADITGGLSRSGLLPRILDAADGRTLLTYDTAPAEGALRSADDQADLPEEQRPQLLSLKQAHGIWSRVHDGAPVILTGNALTRARAAHEVLQRIATAPGMPTGGRVAVRCPAPARGDAVAGVLASRAGGKPSVEA